MPAPPVPPLPGDLRQELTRDRYAAATPLPAPRPHRVDPNIGQSLMPAPAFNIQSAPAHDEGAWSPWNVPRQTPMPPTPAPMAISAAPPLPPPSSSTNALTAELPRIKTLLEAMPAIQQPHFDPSLKITWARDVLFLADRAHHLHVTLTTQGVAPSLTDPIVGPMPFSALDPDLVQLVSAAVPMVLGICAPFPAGQPHSSSAAPLEPWQAEAIYMRAVLSSTGAFPMHVAHNPKTAFRDFETAARGGYAGAWFRLGRDYETFGDLKHARECFERGARLGVESCLYRIGMAHLLGQLGFPMNPNTALPILHRAAVLSSLETPQPAYVYALLLLSEFSSVSIPSATFASLKALTSYPSTGTSFSDPPLIPQGSSPHLESRIHLERSAYLHYPPAQYKLGHAYEFADPPFYFDPLLSVQYYSLASQAGEVEADMALSKWFLCGSTGGAAVATSVKDEVGHFEKDEGLALTFAQKASNRNLPSGHFAMGYYAEAGIGQPPSIPTAMHYYALAANLGNTDAADRLQALRSQSTPVPLDKNVHQQKLERTRTQAWRRAEEEAVSPPYEGQSFPRMNDVAKSSRRETMMMPAPKSAGLPPPQPQYGGAGYNNAPYSAGIGAFDYRPPTQQPQPSGLRPPQQGGWNQQQQQQQAPPPQPKPNRDPRQVVDLVRKSTMSSYAPLSGAAQTLSGGPPPVPTSAGGARPGSSGGRPNSARPISMAPHQNGSGRMPLTSPGPGSRPQSSYQAQGGMGRQSPRPSQAPGRQGSLSVGVDNGYDSVPPVPAVPATATGGSLSTPRPGASTPATGKKTPHMTFAEMGIHGVKAEDKECIVM